MSEPIVQTGNVFFIVAVTTVIVVALLIALRRSAAPKHQVAALPVRRGPDGGIEVLIISTRGSGRWTVPKGWPMRGLSDAEAAAREAYEEAGVRGTIVVEPLGTFEYAKRRNKLQRLVATVYRLDVERQERRWRERGQRAQQWLPVGASADRVAWAGLATIIRSLDASACEPSSARESV